MNISELCINTLKVLSAEQIEKAKSGHPGLPIGAAPMAYTLFSDVMNHNPKNPSWFNRDRFVLSAGHGSALLYSLLHVFGYDLEMEELKNFRQWGSETPGHPEYGYTAGVEATTGPLGQGMAMAVGMAMAEANLAATYNTPDIELVDHYTYALVGDGCLMEGITQEASSLAGTLELSKLIVLYDSNNITIEGRTDIAFTEDVLKRYEALGWDTFLVEDGNDMVMIKEAIEKAKKTSRPAMIEVKTIIGQDTPVADTAAAHGAPLGEKGLASFKEALGWDYPEFTVPEEVKTAMEAFGKEAGEKEAQWNEKLEKYHKYNPDKFEEFRARIKGDFAQDFLDSDEFFDFDGDMATRAASGIVLNRLAKHIPGLMGGSADLGPSNNSVMEDRGYFHKGNFSGTNIHYGVREHAMAAVANGMALHGGLLPYVATFLVFADYLKPALRLSALMGQKVIYILTHDSIGVGEDGPTHQPISQQSMLRGITNLTNFRPADPVETAAAWKYAVLNDGPTTLSLTRQGVPLLSQRGRRAEKGAYVVEEFAGGEDLLIIASGSEVALAMESADRLGAEGIGSRVVSIPSWEVFEKQSDEYKESVMPATMTKRITIEASNKFGWEKYAKDGVIIGMDSFGESAPGNVLFEKFGFTVDNVVKQAKELLEG